MRLQARRQECGTGGSAGGIREVKYTVPWVGGGRLATWRGRDKNGGVCTNGIRVGAAGLLEECECGVNVAAWGVAWWGVMHTWLPVGMRRMPRGGHVCVQSTPKLVRLRRRATPWTNAAPRGGFRRRHRCHTCGSRPRCNDTSSRISGCNLSVFFENVEKIRITTPICKRSVGPRPCATNLRSTFRAVHATCSLPTARSARTRVCQATPLAVRYFSHY